MNKIFLLILGLAVLASALIAKEERSADIVVYGGTSSGIAAVREATSLGIR